jgi:hypothetical protein
VHEAPPQADDFAVQPVTGDWVGFRGAPHRSGLREAPPITRPRIAWSIEVGIQGYTNAPIVTRDAIYVSSQGRIHASPPDQDPADGVYRIDPATGAVVWRLPLSRDARGMQLVGDLLVVGTQSGEVYALDAATGRARWRAATGCPVNHPPLFRDGVMIREATEGLARWDLATGQPVGEVPPCDWNARAGFSWDDGPGWWGSHDRRQARWWTEDGLQWEVEPGPGFRREYQTWAPPLLTRSMVLVTTGRWPHSANPDENTHRPTILAWWRDNGQRAWALDVDPPARRLPLLGPGTPHARWLPWIEGGRLWYTPSSRPELVWADLATGEEAGRLRLPDCRERQFASIVGVPGMGYLARHDGVLHAFTTGETPALAWSLSLGQHGTAGRTTTHSQAPPGGCTAEPTDSTALFATPALGEDGTLYVGAGDGWLYAIRQAD